MEYNNTIMPEQKDQGNTTLGHNFLKEVMTCTQYKIANGIDKWYLVILVPAGVIGNTLAFLVMIQPHNRYMSFSVNICVLSVADTVTLIIGLTKYLNAGYNIYMPPDKIHYCAISAALVASSTECSTWFILAMTFERFYSIMRPHKAASFNTVKKARIIIMCIVVISVLYSLPHCFMTVSEGNAYVPFARGQELLIVKIYFWSDQFLGFVFPFVSLLIMNSVIIHTLCRRSRSLLLSEKEVQGEGQNKGQSSKMTTSEKQIITMLLLVTFGFLILMTPSYGVFYYFSFANLSKSPKAYAGSLLFFSIGEKTLYTNFGINFYLYVISGHKFRGDLALLFSKIFSCFLGKKIRSGDKTTSLSLSAKTAATSVDSETPN